MSTRTRNAAADVRAATVRIHLRHEALRKELARELHRELGGLLMSIRMDLSQLKQYLPLENSEIASRWERIDKALDSCADLKRRLVEQLRPSLLDHAGLCATLEWEFSEAVSNAGLASCIDLSLTELPADAAATSVVLRIVEELIRDCLAAGGRVRGASLKVTQHDAIIVVAIRTDGIGLNKASDPAVSGTLHDIAQVFGCRLNVECTDSHRTIEVTVPLAELNVSLASGAAAQQQRGIDR